MQSYPMKFVRGALMAALCCITPLALAQDMSRLSDFEFPSAYLTQNTAWISQNDSHNQALIDQGPLGPGVIDRQYADIAQIGSDNVAKVAQQGDQNRVRVTQDGLSNSIDLAQSGDGNQFIATQNGGNNSINSNGINTTTGDRDSSMGPAIQRGYNNSIDVIQNSGGNSLSVVQIGNDNVIIFNQNGGLSARLSEMGNNNTINFTQSALTVSDIALKGGEMNTDGLTVKVN